MPHFHIKISVFIPLRLHHTWTCIYKSFTLSDSPRLRGSTVWRWPASQSVRIWLRREYRRKVRIPEREGRSGVCVIISPVLLSLPPSVLLTRPIPLSTLEAAPNLSPNKLRGGKWGCRCVGSAGGRTDCRKNHGKQKERRKKNNQLSGFNQQLLIIWCVTRQTKLQKVLMVSMLCPSNWVRVEEM